MKEYQIRVIEEADELDVKIKKLTNFLFASPSDLPLPELTRMNHQLDAMRLYSYILHNRIKHFLP